MAAERVVDELAGGHVHVENRRHVRIAVVGDVHGQFETMFASLDAWEAALAAKHNAADGATTTSPTRTTASSHTTLGDETTRGREIDVVLQVGDIECHRRDADMTTMAAPASKRALGDFHRVFSGELRCRWPLFFIGGNHECYGWLDGKPAKAGAPGAAPQVPASSSQEGLAREPQPEQQSPGAAPQAGPQFEPRHRALRVAENMYYLGRAGYFPLRLFEGAASVAGAAPAGLAPVGLLNVAFLSGISRADSFYVRRPLATAERFAERSNKEWIGFNCFDLAVLQDDDTVTGVERTLSEQEDEFDLFATPAIADVGDGGQRSLALVEAAVAARACVLLNVRGPEICGLRAEALCESAETCLAAGPAAEVWRAGWRRAVGDVGLSEPEAKLLLRAMLLTGPAGGGCHAAASGACLLVEGDSEELHPERRGCLGAGVSAAAGRLAAAGSNGETAVSGSESARSSAGSSAAWTRVDEQYAKLVAAVGRDALRAVSGASGEDSFPGFLVTFGGFVHHVAARLWELAQRRRSCKTRSGPGQTAAVLPEPFLRRRNAADVLVTHDWPAGIVADAGQRGSRPMGNAPCRELTEALRPWLHCCGHMHFAHRAKIEAAGASAAGASAVGAPGGAAAACVVPTSTPPSTQVCCVAKVGRTHSVAVIEVDLETGVWRELVGPDGEVPVAGGDAVGGGEPPSDEDPDLDLDGDGGEGD